MTSSRMIVAPASFTPVGNGLASVVEWRDGDRHWQAGVQWETVCGSAGTTFDECVSLNAISGNVTGAPLPFPEPPEKAATMSRQTFGATPFTVFGEIECSAVGFVEESQTLAAEWFARNETWELENVFATGTVAGVPNVQFPHLSANVAVVDVESNPADTVILQSAATVVTGVATCADVALGLIEKALAECYKGVGIIHIPKDLIPVFDDKYVIQRVDGELFTTNGNRIVAGGGYTGAAPDGTTDPNVRWVYATTPVFGYRSNIRVFPMESTLDRTVNTVRAIAERNYLLGYDCCLIAVPVLMACD